MVKIKGFVIGLLILCCGVTQLYAASQQEIEKQLKELQERVDQIDGVDSGKVQNQMETEERLGRLESILGNTKVGGWVDSIYSDNDKKNHEQFFDVHHLYLFIDNKFNENWRAFGELEFEHAPEFEGDEGKGELKLERGYIQFSLAEWFNLRFGKYNTPFGIWTPEHWAINVDTIQKPIHEDNKYVPVKQVGIEYFGTVFPEIGDLSMEINYAAYVSNGPEVFGTDDPGDNILGGGADLNIRFNDRVLMGTSFYTQNNPADSARKMEHDEDALGNELPDFAYSDFGREENSFMYYGEILLPFDITLRGEAFNQNRNGNYRDVVAYYAKVKWEFLPGWYINYRRAWGDDEKAFKKGSGAGRYPGSLVVDETGTLVPKEDEMPGHTIDTVTLAYWPVNNVRIKLEYSMHHFEKDTEVKTRDSDGDPDSYRFEEFNTWAFWIGYVF